MLLNDFVVSSAVTLSSIMQSILSTERARCEYAEFRIFLQHSITIETDFSYI